MAATLPSPPSSLAAVLEAASNPNASIDALARVVSGDPAFSAMALRVVNTAKYAGNRGPITNIRMAAMRLGIRTLRNLAVCHAAQSVVSAKQLESFNLHQFWEVSLQRAVAAERIAQRCPGIDASEAFTGGLLMDLGVLALVLEDPARSVAFEAWVELDRPDCLHAETDAFGITRAEVAKQLVQQWKLPDELGIPMAYALEANQAPAPLRTMCHILAAADAVAGVLSRQDTKAALETARTILPRELGWPVSAVEDILDTLGDEVSLAAQTMGFKVGSQPTLDALLQAANKSLVDINVSYEELVQKLEQTIAEKERLAAELDQRNQELELISRTDSLTGLPNRRVLFTDSKVNVARAARHGTAMCMVVSDIDHFKRFNDTWGHVFGDEVLKAVSHTLQASVREADLAARTGGEEFALLLPDTELDGALIVAERARKAIASLKLLSPGGTNVSVTMSFGIAMVVGPVVGAPNTDAMVTRVYQASDEALYEAKNTGRNRVVVVKMPVSWSNDIESAAPISIAV